MRTQTHARNKDYRNLYRANPVENKRTQQTQYAWELDTMRMVKESHKTFWKKRGFTKPPRTGKVIAGDFDLPIPEEGK